MAADFNALLEGRFGGKRSPLAGPERFEIEGRGRLNSYFIAALCQIAAEPGEVRLGAAQRGRVTVNEVKDTHPCARQ
jgi:hypothetical protein